MRLAFVSIMPRAPWAASEVLWAQTALRALQLGHEVLVSVYRWDEVPEAIAELARAGARVDFRPRDRWSRRSALLSRLRRVYRPLEQFAPDAICVSQGGTYDIGRSGSMSELRDTLSRLHAPYVLLCHCEQPAPPSRRLQQTRATFRDAAIVGMLAERLCRLSEQHLDMALPHARVFHNPVNLRRIERLPWPADSTLRLAFVGRLDPVKNLKLLADVLAAPTWLQRDWTLTVCGVGPEREAVELNTALRERIEFAGYVKDIASMWATHHVLIMPSRFEGVPLAMVEAMLCARPVVATDIGGIAEWLQDQRNGFLIARADAGEVAAALERMWNTRSQLEALGARAHQDAVAKRDPDPPATLLQWLEQTAQPASALAR
jgi:glycosyltransferase involved in cell wall biosynthesis